MIDWKDELYDQGGQCEFIEETTHSIYGPTAIVRCSDGVDRLFQMDGMEMLNIPNRRPLRLQNRPYRTEREVWVSVGAGMAAALLLAFGVVWRMV